MHLSGSPLAAYGDSQEEEESKPAPQDLEQYVPSLAGTFFQCRIGATNAATVYEQESVESIISQSEQFATLCLVSPSETMGNILKAAEAVGGPAVVGSDAGYVWLLYIVSGILRSTLHSNAESAGSLYGALLQFSVTCVQQRQASGQRSTDAIETAVVHFLTSLQNVFASRHIGTAVKKVLLLAFENQDKLFQFILMTVGHNMVNPSTNATQIVRQSIDLIAEAARDAPASAKAGLQMAIPPVVQMPLALDVRTYKLRTSLNNALFSLQLPDPYTQDDFLRFMTPIETLMNQSASGAVTDPLFTAGWLRDLRGVSEAASESQSAFTDFVDWIVERSPVFMALSTMQNASSLIVVSLLRLLNQLVTPCRGGRVNLPSACHCPSGVILFKFVAQAVQNIITTNLNSDNLRILSSGQPIPDGAYTSMLKPLFLSLTICKKCVTGEFCPFGAMAMYNDSTFDNLVVGLFRFLAAFPFTLFQQYHKASYAFVDLLRTLVESQVVSPIAAMEGSDLCALIQLCLQLVDDMDTKTSTLLYSLNFLAFISSLYKLIQRAKSGQPPSPTLSPTKSSTRHNETIAGHIAPFNDLWIALIQRSMAVVRSQDRALSGVNSVVFPLFEADPNFWTQYGEYLVSTFPQDKAQEVRDLLAKLSEGLVSSEKFFSGLFTFRSKLRLVY